MSNVNTATLTSTLGGTEAAVAAFGRIERVRLTNFFTPVERADRLRARLPGAPAIYVKRDDSTGYLGGGNKLRKLEYVMADALAQNATTVITTGSVTSNLARTTALVARRLGLKCVLVLSGGDPRAARANSRVAELLGVTVHSVATREDRDRTVDKVANDLERRGERVYRIPLGASDDTGSFGMAAAVAELELQQLELGVRFDAVVLATSSGGTQAGLEAGKRIFGYDRLRILGASADDPAGSIKEAVLKALNPMLARVGLPADVRAGDLSVDDSFVGGGYGVPTAESEEAMRLFAETEGLLLDPVYTAKGAAAFLAYCRGGRFAPTDNVLFWHTGGLMTLI